MNDLENKNFKRKYTNYLIEIYPGIINKLVGIKMHQYILQLNYQKIQPVPKILI